MSSLGEMVEFPNNKKSLIKR